MINFDQYRIYFAYDKSPDHLAIMSKGYDAFMAMSPDDYKQILLIAFDEHKQYWEARGHKYEMQG